jgi:hypothetical protein
MKHLPRQSYQKRCLKELHHQKYQIEDLALPGKENLHQSYFLHLAVLISFQIPRQKF